MYDAVSRLACGELWRQWHEAAAPDRATAEAEVAMKAIARRLRRLEDQFAPADGKQRVLAVVGSIWADRPHLNAYASWLRVAEAQPKEAA